jgi:hypothetical protein
MKNNKGIAAILIVLIIIGVLVLGGIYYFLVKKTQKPVSCTLEAKICPDGSTVGRTGPNCEFAECPAEKSDETADWKTYKNEEYGFEVKYPNNWYAEPEDLADLSAKLSIIFGNYPIKESSGRKDYTSVNFVVEETPALDEYLNEMKKYGAKIEETNIASNKAYKTTATGKEVYLGDNLNPSISITTIHNNYMYGLLILYPNEISEKVFNQIVSTFRFLD